ncbi:MAG: RNA polymerase sigma factor [Bacteroidales bacterium]|nr:RNA polymerase sigma factor [Bacteroidales bacterium]
MVDPGLIEECRNGNLQNFRKLIGISSPFAFSVAFRMLGDEDLAKDVVQETMITVWEKLKRIKSAESYKTWLYRIVVNKCYDQMRMKKRHIEERADDKTWAMIANHFSEKNSSALDNRETAMIINLLTEKLSPRQKSVFVLSDLEEMTPEEISSITGMSRRNIKANLHYARKNIGAMLEKYL